MGYPTPATPAGHWLVLRMGYSPTGVPNHPVSPEGTGLEVDKLSNDEISAALQAGDNALTVRVTNLWVNRIIGDRQPGVDWHQLGAELHGAY